MHASSANTCIRCSEAAAWGQHTADLSASKWTRHEDILIVDAKTNFVQFSRIFLEVQWPVNLKEGSELYISQTRAETRKACLTEWMPRKQAVCGLSRTAMITSTLTKTSARRCELTSGRRREAARSGFPCLEAAQAPQAMAETACVGFSNSVWRKPPFVG